MTFFIQFLKHIDNYWARSKDKALYCLSYIIDVQNYIYITRKINAIITIIDV